MIYELPKINNHFLWIIKFCFYISSPYFHLHYLDNAYIHISNKKSDSQIPTKHNI